MGQAIPRQHPAVVLRSHFKALRAMLAVAMIAIVGLSAAVVILATDDDRDQSTSSATQAGTPSPSGTTRYDGGPEEGTRGIVQALRPGVRFDGGPEEGTRGVLSSPAPANAAPAQRSAPAQRFDGGPEEGTAASLTKRSAPATFDPNSIKSPPGVRYDGGPEEGTRGPGH
jgi:hypothetical protein